MKFLMERKTVLTKQNESETLKCKKSLDRSWEEYKKIKLKNNESFKELNVKQNDLTEQFKEIVKSKKNKN